MRREKRSTNTLTVTDTTGMLFLTAANTYDNKSKEFTVTNRSSVDVDITVDITVTENDGISIVNTNSFGGSTAPAMYLALEGKVDSEDAVTTYLGSDGKLSQSAKVLNDKDDYQFDYSDDGSYSYSNSLTGHTDSKYVFSLSGGANSDADWTSVTSVTPGIELTWKIVEHVEGPQVSVSKDDDAKTITVSVTDLTAEKEFVTMKMSDGTNEYSYDVVPETVVKTGDNTSAVTIVLSDGWYDGFAGKTVTFTATLKDGTTVVGNIAIP